MISVSFLLYKHADVVNVVKKVKLDNQGFEIRIRTDAFNAVMICDVVFKNKGQNILCQHDLFYHAIVRHRNCRHHICVQIIGVFFDFHNESV